MPGPRNRNLRTDLAVAVASGRSVAGWAREHNVPPRTAYSWAKSPEFKAAVEQYRRRAVDRAIGRLSRAATRAVDEIVKLTTGAKSEAVKLAAARAVLAELMAVTSHAENQKQLDELRARITSLEAGAGENRDEKTPG
jgi:hypothetical protein